MGPLRRKFKKDLHELVELDKKHKPRSVFRFQKRLLAVANQKEGRGDLRSRLTAIFREIDSDGSYTLTEDEMIVFCNEKLKLNMRLANVSEVCKFYDDDGGRWGM
jgi:Ca2+-binding EF-hand superfamily protein